MTHDFKTAVVELHGVTQTHRIEQPYGGKNIDALCQRFAQSLETGLRHPALPTFRDAAIASEYAWRFADGPGHHGRRDMGMREEREGTGGGRRTIKTGIGRLRNRAGHAGRKGDSGNLGGLEAQAIKKS